MAFRTIGRQGATIVAAFFATFAGGPAVFATPPPIQAPVNPPARVGRLAQVTGAVSFHAVDADRWAPALLNFPVTSGDSFWTESDARAAISVSGNRLSLDHSTELDVSVLDDHALVVAEPQGEVCIHLLQLPLGDSYSVQTPRGTVQLTSVGRYEIVAGDLDHPTTVQVVDGAAQVTGANLSLQVKPGQTASITGADTVAGTVGPMQTDTFLTGCLAEEHRAAGSALALPPLVQTMTGADDLAQYGEWQETPQYGRVWYPRVEAGWVPYRDGRWSYVAPWGWTWVDLAPWGFAPFHYGRWIERDHRWGWIPAEASAYGDVSAPVYAPALVSFVATEVGIRAPYAVAPFAGGSIGWVPLGPREVYYPPYRTTAEYIRSVNRVNVTNVSQVISDSSIHTSAINNTRVAQSFINRSGITVMPAAAMTASQPVAAAAQRLPDDRLAQMRGLSRPPVNPGAATVGVTPSVARQFAFALAATTAPGPAFERSAARPGFPPLQGHPAASVPDRSSSQPAALRQNAAGAMPQLAAPSVAPPRPVETPSQAPGAMLEMGHRSGPLAQAPRPEPSRGMPVTTRPRLEAVGPPPSLRTPPVFHLPPQPQPAPRIRPVSPRPAVQPQAPHEPQFTRPALPPRLTSPVFSARPAPTPPGARPAVPAGVRPPPGRRPER